MSRDKMPLPQTTMGSDRPMPNSTRMRSPWAAAATAKTLSRLIVTSARTMIQIASLREVPPRTASPAAAPGRTSLTAIQSSRRPPASWTSGIANRALTRAIPASRRTTAAAVPQMRAWS
jgi:hypothetical protein